MPKTKYNDRQMNIRLPDELVAQAQAKAAQQKRSLSEIIRDLLRAWLGQK